MSFDLFEGTGRPRRPVPSPDNPDPRPWDLPDLPEWRKRNRSAPKFAMPKGLTAAVNTALNLRRPLLLTGAAGSGKSTVVELIAAELGVAPVLRWHITSKTTLQDGLYEYDALERLRATQNNDPDSSIERFVKLGPLGTALADREKPRAVLIDEIDKSDLDLPGDMLNVLEAGEFEITPLWRTVRADADRDHLVRGADGREDYLVSGGMVRTEHYPVIVFTSNQERTFPAPFLRRCVRYKMEPPDEEFLTTIVTEHLGGVDARQREIIGDFARRLREGQEVAISQLIELVELVTSHRLGPDQVNEVREILLEPLAGK
ncbi:AAA family ATPase [Actinomadura chibensis]|uniref:AAA domain-containing protein n=1 Tax=Actinomadura chibensis TaxID=392828 RepID=A0A5D0NIE3_9ACTN|nr:MoxR family ATPase [Actinomadura chibensis]TYB43961.1 AAA domain-containing protein [Actinomadura chibensis]